MSKNETGPAINTKKKFTRPLIIVANWKMYKTTPESLSFLDDLSKEIKNPLAKVYLAAPFTLIKPLVEKSKDSSIAIGAQNMHDASEGAFTGEISGKMLKDIGARFVILGHSERRKIFGETNAFINKKLKRAVADRIQPILCVGETHQERECQKTESVLEDQIKECLADLSSEDLSSLILAYEPVWAIGSSLAATPETAEAAHLFCRNVLEKKFGAPLAEKTPILYGGSVKPANAKKLLEEPDVDGLLVGGASLATDSFSQIINSLNDEG